MNFTAALLAGGRSTRMGRDKAGVDVCGEPLWQRQLKTLQATGPVELLISGRTDGPYAASGYRIIVDEDGACGPLAGLAATLRAAEHEMVMLLAIDLPLITPAFLRDLLESASFVKMGIVTGHGKRFEPLAAIYTRACLPLVCECLEGSDHSMQRFIRLAKSGSQLYTRDLTEQELAMFRNVNTPDDLPL
jgi:molybdopterin-guanine dinucleotide biosynthesis protein A